MRIRLPHSLFSLLAACLLMGPVLVACNGYDMGAPDDVIAEVNGETLTLSDVRSRLSEAALQSDSARAVGNYKRQWIYRRVLVNEAERQGVHRDSEVQQQLRRAREEVLIQALSDKIALQAEEEDPVTRQDAQRFYEQHRDEFVLDERHVRYRHVIADQESDVQNARNALHRGVEWEEVAERYVVNPEAAVTQAQRFQPISQAAADYPELNDLLERIGIEEMSPVRFIEGRYHFVQLMDVREEGDHPQIDWILDRVAKWLEADRNRQRFSSFRQNLLLQADANNEISIYDVDPRGELVEIETDTLTPN